MQLEQAPRLSVVGAALIVALVGALSASAGTPTLFRPLSLLVAVPALIIASMVPLSLPFLVVLASLPVAFAFLAWVMPWAAGSRLPRRSMILLACGIFLTFLHFAASWRLGTRYQGQGHTIGVALVDAAWIVALLLLLQWERGAPSFGKRLLFHGALFAWLASYALPWLGEMP